MEKFKIDYKNMLSKRYSNKFHLYFMIFEDGCRPMSIALPNTFLYIRKCEFQAIYTNEAYMKDTKNE